MSFYPIAGTGIRFNDCLFSEPVTMSHWVPPHTAGIAVVLVRDARWAPRPFQPICFAEFGNSSRLVQPMSGYFYVATFPMPFSTSGQRRALRRDLIASYNPVGQPAETSAAEDLSRRINELEARQQEQNAQIVTMLSHLCKLFEPQPVGPRRPIGFVPAEAY